MSKEKIYCYDDDFKAKARKHQFLFREMVLNDFYEEKNPQVFLSPDSARQGLIFCEEYRYLIHRYLLSRGKFFGTSALFSNMLRSEHIPYNIFAPMEEDRSAATDLFNEIIGGGILCVEKIEIEFAGETDKSEYLQDGTSFDVFVKYKSIDGKQGGIGIEVKYTEKGYPIGKEERKKIEKIDGPYKQMTKESDYYVQNLDIMMFLKANHLRQIWRNHILGYSMLKKGDIQYFCHIHLYPNGNKHFHKAIPEYYKLLTEKGAKTFIPLTYEKLFDLLSKYFITEKQIKWQEYLQRRYIV